MKAGKIPNIQFPPISYLAIDYYVRTGFFQKIHYFLKCNSHNKLSVSILIFKISNFLLITFHITVKSFLKIPLNI